MNYWLKLLNIFAKDSQIHFNEILDENKNLNPQFFVLDNLF